jgi:hypothetical protein
LSQFSQSRSLAVQLSTACSTTGAALQTTIGFEPRATAKLDKAAKPAATRVSGTMIRMATLRAYTRLMTVERVYERAGYRINHHHESAMTEMSKAYLKR